MIGARAAARTSKEAVARPRPDLKRLISATRFAVVDLETTGLYPDRGDRVCELAVVQVRGGTPASVWHSLVNPERRMSSGAFAISGIADDVLQEAPSMAVLAPQIWSLLDGRVLVTHNAAFAVGFLRSELGPLGFPVESLWVVDMMAVAKRHLPDGPRDLDSLAEVLSAGGRVARRALPDAQLTAAVLGRFTSILDRDGASLSALLPRPADLTLRSPDPFGQVLLRIEEALTRHVTLAIRYYSPWNARITERRVEPLRVSDDYYLEAYCQLRGATRRFRIDRIRSADLVTP